MGVARLLKGDSWVSKRGSEAAALVLKAHFEV